MKRYEKPKQNEPEELETNSEQVQGQHVAMLTLQMVKTGYLWYSDTAIRSPEDAYQLLRDFLGQPDRENFVVMTLDTKNQPTSIYTAHIGDLNGSVIHPREIFKTSIMSNSASIILCHNHPSGILQPSSEDLEATRQVMESGSVLRIDVLDHLILGNQDDFLSLKEKGYM
ncbi:JAB domain-containing protein [Salibacterium qingdaonense]|uniref:DNA repair protein RadC n=1 Tax=Salibacterium qingdaonense TaxID=266892 RepID=A0A1I4NXQ1_9BACI|nr:JAB domain-containing protein [Salibacterium qingdaonense]SFM20311.1 DNA repair protein RadC [Salibacterium qingdaonense]